MNREKRPSNVRHLLIGAGILALIVELAVIVVGGARFSTPIVILKTNGELNVAATRRAISLSMKRFGSRQTYETVKKEMGTLPPENTHGAAHLFGETLFRYDGMNGITVCDASFSFGCFHGFLGKAVASVGLAGVSKIDDVCVRQYGSYGLGCAHGIGHGLGEYLGPAKLSEQLDACETLTWKGRFFGCKEGVFMEYNMPVTGETSQVRLSVRPFDANAPYGPCPSVAKAYQPACYMELSNWWEETFARDYAKIGPLCGEIRDPSNREACYLGVGYTEGPKDKYSLEKTKETCARMPDASAELLCRAGASWSFFAMPAHRGEADEVCELGDSDRTQLCKRKADLLSYTK